MVKIAIVDHSDLAEDLYAFLRNKGYNEVKYFKDFHEMESPGEFDILLMHPGVQNQAAALTFAFSHPKIKTAIITPLPFEYNEKRGVSVLFYGEKAIMDFIEAD